MPQQTRQARPERRSGAEGTRRRTTASAQGPKGTALAALQAQMRASPRVTQLQALQKGIEAGGAQRDLREDAPLRAVAEGGAPLQAVAEEEEPLQAMAEGEELLQARKSARSPAGGDRALPAPLQAGIEALSGHSVADVRVHRNSDAPARVGALAYARGREIHLGPGQDKHLPHEAWHVVQQAQGRVRPTMQAKGVAINDDAGLEAEADRMGERAVNGGILLERPTSLREAPPRSPAITQRKLEDAHAPEEKIQVYADGEVKTVIVAKAFTPGDTQVVYRESARKKKGKFIDREMKLPAKFAFELGVKKKQIEAQILALTEAAKPIEGAKEIDPELLQMMYERIEQSEDKPAAFDKNILAAEMLKLDEAGYPCKTKEGEVKPTDPAYDGYFDDYENELLSSLQGAGAPQTDGPRVAAPGEGKNTPDWKTEATVKAKGRVIERLGGREGLSGTEAAVRSEILQESQLAHKIPKLRIKKLAPRLGGEWSEKKLVNWRPNLELAPIPNHQVDEAREEFDPNVGEDGHMTPRSRALSEIDAMIQQDSFEAEGVDARELQRRLDAIEKLHEDKLAEGKTPKGELSDPVLSQWSEEDGRYRRRRPYDSK